MMLAPSRIYFSQDSISNKFRKSTEHAGILIGETLDKILTGECIIHDIDPIRVVRRKTQVYQYANVNKRGVKKGHVTCHLEHSFPLYSAIK